MEFKTLNVRFNDSICFIQFNRPDANNTINDTLIEECNAALSKCDDKINIVVLEGLPEVFCFGADFKGLQKKIMEGGQGLYDPEPLYALWLKLASGPFIVISHVRGRANAGGVGFVASSDIVLADNSAQFSLSELLFGLYPACVLPFLIRRLGFQKSHYLTLMTKPITAQQAHSWGLVDAFQENSEILLKQHILRLKNIPKNGIMRYKKYMGDINDIIFKCKEPAVSANIEMFSNAENLERIKRFVETGKYPWES